jgi:ribonuclease R
MKSRLTMILKLLRQRSGEPVPFKDLVSHCGIGKGERRAFQEQLDRHAAEGKMHKVKGNRYALPEEGESGKARGITGRLSVHRDGFGFVIPDGEGEDIFIPARYLRENMHGDLVEVSVTRGREGKREGRILRTLERGCTKVVGRFHDDRGGGFVAPDEQRLPRQIVILPRGKGNAVDGQIVTAEITAYPSGQQRAAGRIVEVLGWPDDPDTEALTIVRKFDLPVQFPEEALAAARAVPQTVPGEDVVGRTDLRGFLTVTIDGETARDFDDAVSVVAEQGGNIRLRVSIADVAHYVQPGSALDGEAYRRGTSVYFPDRCLPMLPEELSNGICSLNPLVDRLALTAEMLFDKTGAVQEKKFYPSIIRSAARLTYTTVRKILADGDPETIEAHRHLLADLRLMEELSRRLTARRRQRGSIDFDLPEPEIILDLQGQTEAIVKAERNLAHRLIEEFMLAANEAVATWLEGREIPSLYRVHEPPDPVKLNDFREFVHSFGYALRMEEDRVEPRELQGLLDLVEGKPEERMINEVLLRCMKQARYMAENLGHFGLAAPSYTHFTSPIRRYPDLVVHRILKRALAGGIKERERERLSSTLPDIAAHTSSRERIAMEAEREIVALKKVQFMRDRVGEEFTGYICGVTPHGFFVELVDLFVEGMVHVSTLGQDFYRYVEKQHALVGERTGATYRIGDKVGVLVAAVSTERKQIDFVLAGVSVPAAAAAPVPGDESYPRVPVKGKRPKGAKRDSTGEQSGSGGKKTLSRRHPRKRR